MKFQQIEIYLASILSNFFTLFMMVAVAATLFVNKIYIQGAAEAALAIKPFAGNLAGTFFGIGLLAAGFLGCVIVPLSTAYAFSEFFGYRGSLNDNFKKSRFFYVFFLVQIIIGAVIVMQPKFSLFQFTLYADFLNGISLPVIFYFLYKFSNDPDLMDKFKNNWFQNFLIIFSAILIIACSLIGIVGKIFRF
jgi:Mn2+/Fe2+ NRAMP family transporter